MSVVSETSDFIGHIGFLVGTLGELIDKIEDSEYGVTAETLDALLSAQESLLRASAHTTSLLWNCVESARSEEVETE